MPLSPELDPHFEEAARLNNLDPQLLRAIAMGESSGRAGVTSEAGAGGLMQIMPDTAKRYGVADPYDPVQAIYGGAKILNDGLTKAEQLKQSGRNVQPVEYALKTYFGGDDGPDWGPKTAAYPGYIWNKYQGLTGAPAPTGAAKLAAAGQPVAVQPLSNDAAPAPNGVAQLAAAGRQATPGAADMSAIPKAAPGTVLAVPGMPNAQQTAQAIPSNEELLRGLQEIAPLLKGASGGNAPSPGGQTATPAPAASGQPSHVLLGPSDIAAMLQAAQAAKGGFSAVPGLTSALETMGKEGVQFVRRPDGSIGLEPIAGAVDSKRQIASGTKQGNELLQPDATGALVNQPGAVESAAGKAGAVTAAQQAETYRDLRSGVLAKGGTPILAVPQLEKVTDPITGQEAYKYLTPPLPGQPDNNMSHGGDIAKLGPGQNQSLETRAKTEQEQRQKTIDEAALAQRDRATIQNMVSEEGKFVSGPFAEHAQEAARYLRLIDPTYDKQVASYEDFAKNSGQLVRQAVRETSARAAVQEFSMIRDTMPSPDMSPKGRMRVQNEMLGLYDYREAKAQAQQQWEEQHGGIGHVEGFETAFQKQASPWAFIVARMDPETRQELIGKMKGNDEGRRELGRLSEQLKFIKESGISP